MAKKKKKNKKKPMPPQGNKPKKKHWGFTEYVFIAMAVLMLFSTIAPFLR